MEECGSGLAGLTASPNDLSLIHIYSMNGQTGKVAGILPLDRKKLLRDAVLALSLIHI